MQTKINTIPFISAQKMKYLGVNLMRYIQNLYMKTNNVEGENI